MDENKKIRLGMIARNLVEPGKGILAADESPKSLDRRFQEFNLKNDEKTRRRFRELLFREINDKISGVILHEETFKMKADDGELLPDILQKKEIYVGIKLDKGLSDFSDQEKVSIGLEDLEMRINKPEYKVASFAKWRSVFSISKNTPTDECISENCHVLAQYAAIAQKHNLVPIVEPEILWNGDFTLEECISAAKRIFSSLIYELNKEDVYMSGVLIKTSFLTAGSDNVIDPLEMANATIGVLADTIPCSIPGIVFLSGGHSPGDSIIFLDHVNRCVLKHTWALSFSFGRALTDPFLREWKGSDHNAQKASSALREGIDLCSRASSGSLERH